MSLKHLVVARSLLTSLALSLALTLLPSQPTWAAGPPADELLGRTVFQVLLGEMALRRGEVELSLDAWSDLAERTRDPHVIARAVEIAGFVGHNERGLRLVRLWQSIEPNAEKARQAEVALLIQARQLDRLETPLATLLKADPENLPTNLLQLNRMMARIPDKAAVFQLIDKLTTPYPQMPEAHFALAQAALATGDETRALTAIDTALKLRPSWEMAAIAQAKLLGRNQAALTIERLSQFVKQQPDANDARLALSQTLIAEKRYAEARQHYERLLKDNPDEPNILYPAAILALQSGDLVNGRRQLEQLLETPFPDKSSVHFFLGQIAQESEQTELAITHFHQVSTGERYVAARARMAVLLIKQGKRAEALELLRNTRGNSPAERTQLALAEAQLLREANDQASAYVALEKALSNSPDDPELRYDAALTAERLGRHQALEDHLKHLLARHPDHPHALNALGYSLAERNIRLDEAEALLKRALALAPDDAYIIDSMGWLQYRQGRLNEALQTLEKAYRLKADPEIAAHLGEVLWTLERRAEARKIWQEARQRDPDNSTLKAALEKFQP